MASKNSDKTPKAKRKPATGRVAKRVARGKTAGKTVGKIAVGKKSPGGGFSRERGGRRGGRSSCPAKEVDQFLSEHLHTEDALISDGNGCNGEAMVGKKTLRPRKMIVRYEEDEDSIGGGDKATAEMDSDEDSSDDENSSANEPLPKGRTKKAKQSKANARPDRKPKAGKKARDCPTTDEESDSEDENIALSSRRTTGFSPGGDWRATCALDY